MDSPYRPHLRDRLKRAFDRGVQPEILKRLQTNDQRQRAVEITKQAWELREKARTDHREKYDVRVKHMVAKVRDEWTRPNRELKPYFAYRDRLDASDLRMEAEKRVRRRYEQLVARIDAGERLQLARLAGLPERSVPERSHRVSERTREREVERSTQEPSRTKLRLAFDRTRDRTRD